MYSEQRGRPDYSAPGSWREAAPGSGHNGSGSEGDDTGRPVLRIAGPDDATALMKLKQRLDQETSFMLLEPGERDTSTQALARHLEDVSRSRNSNVPSGWWMNASPVR